MNGESLLYASECLGDRPLSPSFSANFHILRTEKKKRYADNNNDDNLQKSFFDIFIRLLALIELVCYNLNIQIVIIVLQLRCFMLMIYTFYFILEWIIYVSYVTTLIA